MTAARYAIRVGQRMRQVRQERRMTLAGTEKASDGRFQANTLACWERGQRGISMTKLAEYAEWLGISVRILLPPDPGEKAWRQSIASDAAARALRSVTDTVTTITPAEATGLLVLALTEQVAS